MSISAITTSAPLPKSTPVTVTNGSATKTHDPSNDNSADDATEAQPPVVAALPPGQGTRIDQIA
jgi:hypothetical protein